ncbi:MAG TPA: carboxypeptidase-like regulatory domain-containing protein [Candidatus Acidoferrales bacterium]|nr:carboxypeptidase-like regulatory domain-containing protein [Candidatus Acidoferrales bacterium]
MLMLAATGLAVGQVARADAEILAPVALAYQAAIGGGSESTPPPNPEPSPSPAPSPKPRASASPSPIRGGGRLIFNFIGSLSLGRTSTTSTFGQTGFFTPTPTPSGSASPGPFPFQNANTNTESAAELGAGVTASLSRRTASTLSSLILPVGISGTGRSAFGAPQFLYSTPKYSLGYGEQQLNALGQFQMGYTLRGFDVITPAKNGQVTYFEGPVEGANGEQAQLYGALLQEARGRSLYEAGFNYANGPDTGSAKTVLFGAATAGRNLSLISEGAWQTRSNGDGDPHGLALQTRLDDFAQGGECSSTLRSVPDQFVTYSAGEIFSDRYADLNCHDSKSPIFFDANWERTGDAFEGVNTQNVATIGYSPTMRFGGLSLTYTRQDGSSSGESVWSNDGTAAVQTQFFHTSLLLGAQMQNSLLGTTKATSRSYLINLNKQITRHLSVGISGQVQNQSNLTFATPSASATPGPEVVSLAPSLQKGLAFNVAQSFRKTTVQLGETITRTISDSSNAIQETPLLTLVRQISPSISVSTSLGYQVLRDSLDPAANGRTRVFSISLSAPFSYGNSNVTGRVDPRLPATIVGKVLYASTATGVGASANFSTFTGTGGVGNVLVTLDGKFVERTDLSGGFQFSFIPPGPHQLMIDASTMPRGFTAAIPVQNITVQGGQTATVSFTIGTYGGVLGHVYGADANGNPIPLDDVQLRVDGGAYAKTDDNGAYGFGGLTAGQHEITIIPQSVPATAQFPPEALTQKVTVSDGRYSTLDFHAELLGSIAGSIVYAKETGPQLAGLPALNAYVVAEPGEHAAIDEDDGSFIIDNLPAGDYTVSVDPETLLPGMGAAPDDVTVHLAPGEHYGGLHFEVGQFEKKVVFSLLGGNGPATNLPPAIRLSEAKLPPRGTTTVTISAPQDATGVTASAFGKKITLSYDKAIQRWLGEIEVPEKTAAGRYPVTGTVAGATPPEAVSLTVDPKLPLAIVQILTPHPYVGETVIIRARFLVDVHPGDKITWQDGEETVLGKPVSGRVFTFQKALTLLPLHGLLLTPHGPIPIEVL